MVLLCTKVVRHQLDKEYQGIEEFWKPHHRKRAIVYSYTLLECPTVSERGIVSTMVLFGLLMKLENKISHSASSEVIELYIYFSPWFKLLFTSGWYKKLEFNNVILNCGWQFNLLEFERSFVELFYKDFDFISQVSLDLDSSRQWDNNSKKSREGNCCASFFVVCKYLAFKKIAIVAFECGSKCPFFDLMENLGEERVIVQRHGEGCESDGI